MNALTKFVSNEPETDKSDKTVGVSNSDFLRAIFGEHTDNAHPMLVSFKGNPKKVEKNKWTAYPWKSADLVIPTNTNNYFSLARFTPNDAGEYRRKKAQFQGLYAIVLDDVGTTVSMERLTLEPSWLLETSPGNYQAGFILFKPITETKEADQLMNAIVSANLCDPGANGPTARLARLPIGINGKHDPVFVCRLEKWQPETIYTTQELVDGLQLELVEKKSRHITRQADNTHNEDTEEIWSPRPEENEVLSELKRLGIYKQPLGECKHDITCPWASEHTGHLDSGTAYFEPDDNYPIGGFKCQHGHCAHRHIRDLLSFLNINVRSARMKPTIRIMKGEIHRIVDRAELELASGHRHYQRGGMIAYIYTDPSTNESSIQNITLPALVRALSSVATWELFDKRSNEWVRIDPPARHASVLFDSVSYRHLPIIHGIARQPYLRPDGTLMKEAGYDTTTNMFGVFDSKKFNIPINPTKKDAIDALKVIEGLLDEFCFNHDQDKAAALSAILTAAIRPNLAFAPMFHVHAHAVGSGKSHLCALITAFASHQRGTPTTFPADDEECRKLLLAELLKSPAVIEFDNLTSDILPHKSLCTALTSEYISGRILGVSKTATVSTRTLFLSSGNNVSPIKDMSRRTVTINLNPVVEIPAAREFKRPNLIAEVYSEREKYVSAAITIILAWINAGRPTTKSKPLSGFSDWSNLCRQPLLWLEHADPAASVFLGLNEDPERELLGRFLNSWFTVFGNSPTMIRQAIEKSNCSLHECKILNEVLHDIADERSAINHRRLGRWVMRHEGQIVGGLRLVKCTGNTSSVQWRVESVTSVLSISKDEIEKNASSAAEQYRRMTEGE